MKKLTRTVAPIFALGVALTACGGGYDRAEFVDELVTEGGGVIDETQANCIADGLEAQIGVDRLGDRGSLTAEEEGIVTSVTTDCILGS